MLALLFIEGDALVGIPISATHSTQFGGKRLLKRIRVEELVYVVLHSTDMFRRCLRVIRFILKALIIVICPKVSFVLMKQLGIEGESISSESVIVTSFARVASFTVARFRANRLPEPTRSVAERVTRLRIFWP